MIEKNQEKDVENDLSKGVDYQAEHSSFQEEEMSGSKELSSINLNDETDFVLDDEAANGESYPLDGIEELKNDALDRDGLSNYDEVKLDLGEVKDDANSVASIGIDEARVLKNLAKAVVEVLKEDSQSLRSIEDDSDVSDTNIANEDDFNALEMLDRGSESDVNDGGLDPEKAVTELKEKDFDVSKKTVARTKHLNPLIQEIEVQKISKVKKTIAPLRKSSRSKSKASNPLLPDNKVGKMTKIKKSSTGMSKEGSSLSDDLKKIEVRVRRNDELSDNTKGQFRKFKSENTDGFRKHGGSLNLE